MRAADVAVVLHVAEQRDGLQRLAQAHLVGQDAVDAVLVQRDHPVQAAHLEPNVENNIQPISGSSWRKPGKTR